ncbi:MAG TPA: PAS domain S-box protein, partial [Thermodesulfobacteriota bacterium]|nr:PAS domain S-box protein [Thermodesulfobacteriota bacterium]
MDDNARTQKHLISELGQLRQRVAEFEAKTVRLAQHYEALFAQAIGSGQANIFCLDIPSGEFIASAPAKALHGLPVDVSVDSTTVMAKVHPEDLPRVEAAWKRCIERGEHYLMEYRVLKPDGGIRWIAAQAQLLPGPRGLKLVEMCQDTTKRKEAEEKLYASEQRYRLLFEKMTEGFALAEIILDELGQPFDYRLLEVNPAAGHLTGIPPEVAVGKTARELVPSIGQEWIDTFGKVALTGEAITFERYSQLLNKWIRVLAFSPERGKFACLLVDVTERKRAEEALREAKEQLEARVQERTAELQSASRYARSLIEASVDPLVTISPAGKITDVNQATEDVTGVARKRLIGSDFSSYFTKPDEAEAGYQQVLAQGEVRDYPLTIQHTSGHTTDVLYNATLYHNEAGQMQGVFAAARDVTARKRAEAAVQVERQRLFDVLETLPVYVCLLRPDYRRPFANRKFREWFSYHPDKTCYEFLFNRSQPCENCETYTVLKTNAPHRWEWTGPNGRNYDIFDFPFTDTDGSPLILEMGIDITERKQAEGALTELNETLEERIVQRTAELQQSQEDLNRAQAVGQIGWWRLDTRRNMLTWSAENHRIFGVPEGTPMTYEFFLSRVHPDDRHYVDTQWKAALRGEPYDIEHRIVADGQVKWVREKAYLEFYSDGKLLGGFGITQNITAIKNAEQALREGGEI